MTDVDPPHMGGDKQVTITIIILSSKFYKILKHRFLWK